MTLQKLGVMNQGWGVCGFTSCLYGLWDVLDPSKRSQLHGGTKAHRLLAEIKTYFTMLEAAGNTKMKNDIEQYCRVFGEAGNSFGKFTIHEYIQRVNASVTRTEADVKGDADFGLGMPPHAVADYLQTMWNCKSTVMSVSDRGGPQDGIIGVKNTRKPLSLMYDGLEHWLYRRNGLIYSWGLGPFHSVDEASEKGNDGEPWQICSLITL